MRDERLLLGDILDAIQRIDKYTARGRADFDADELIQTFIVHQIQVIGEAVMRLPDAWKQAHPGVPWRLIVGMRKSWYMFTSAWTSIKSGRRPSTICRI